MVWCYDCDNDLDSMLEDDVDNLLLENKSEEKKPP